MQRRMWREGHRRSPRISALDVRKAQLSRVDPVTSSLQFEHKVKKPPREWGKNEGTRKKRKLRPLQDVASLPNSPQEPSSSDEQDDGQTTPEDLHINCEPPILQSNNVQNYDGRVMNPGQHHITPCVSWMPDKRLLEFIVDILQRRDTHEIFAEPVDPNEVEDYYEIIKEPMDFGTMRAKLHEGMYRSLEQFEHDVFLISKNAMHFNSSGTIYFRQARAIDELAKKVFHVLKTDPANFENEFSGTRRRTNRKVKSEARSSTNGSPSKPATNSRSSSVAANISRKSLPISSGSKLMNIRTTSRVFPGYSGSGTFPQSDIIDDDLPFGERVGDGRGPCFPEADRRSLYKSWFSVLNQNYSVVSPITSRVLTLQDVRYNESLMRFAKDLGPTAQMIAKSKLNGFSSEATNYLNFGSILPKAPNHNKYATSGISQISTMTDNSKTKKMSHNLHIDDRIDMSDDDKGGGDNRMRLIGGSFESLSHGNHKCFFGASRLAMEAAGTSSFHSSDRGFGNFSVAGLNMEDEKSTKVNQDYSLSSGSWPVETVGAGISSLGQTLSSQYMRDSNEGVIGDGSLAEKTWALKSSQNQAFMPGSVSDFMFDLPSLKTRLDQMSSLGQGRFLQQNSGTNLALQL